jgi:hypothetical protein
MRQDPGCTAPMTHRGPTSQEAKENRSLEPPVYFSWLCGKVPLSEASGSIPDMRLCFTIH